MNHAMQQVPLALVPEGEQRFDNYLPGPNAAVLTQLADAVPPAVPVFLWGDAGSGKTHLLQALAHACRQRGWRVATMVPGRAAPELAGDEVLILVDDAHRLNADDQQAAFALCVQAQAQGTVWAASAPVPPVDLPLRDDLRTRLAWGQVHALQPLDEEQTREALGAEAERRGMPLSPDVLNYLMSRLDRDLASLMRWIDRLDRYSLARGRALTVPLVRSMLQEPAAAQDAE